MQSTRSCLALLALALATASHAQYSFRVIASGLDAPTGIAVRGVGQFLQIFYSQNPTPGVPGNMGGLNSVRRLMLPAGMVSVLHDGEPDPVNLALAQNGTLYWTCRSAGVILRRTPNGIVSPFLTNLTRPSGIAVGRAGIYYTLVPSPGVPGAGNSVNFFGTSPVVFSMGEPEPVDITISDNGTAYWTCKSAGVILRRTPDGTISPLATGLNQPVGIAVNSKLGRLFFTEVPTPGVPGSMGGLNKVRMIDLASGSLTTIHTGDPDPQDIASLPDGRVFWTCTSAGVIVEGRPVF